ncbi:MAG TPA: HD domain-containing phosphohydrolase, partial [Thermoanaerobaculia bacterium]|nr:HD domain-containing phosphohydrolase [Thermoanaerobaculia bacterium]
MPAERTRLTPLIHSNRFPFDRYRESVGAAVYPTSVDRLEDLPPGSEGPSVILIDSALAANQNNGRFTDSVLIAIGPDAAEDERLLVRLPAEPSPAALGSAVRGAAALIEGRRRNRELEIQLRERTLELQEVNKIGIALSTERDHDVLLVTILTKCRELSRSDAGSLYLLDELPEQGKILRWKLAQNDSIEVDFEEQILPITKKSLAGYVALTGETLIIDDAYALPAGVEYSINRSFDLGTGYRTKSIAVFPMMNHTGDTIGVLQLINRKRAGATGRVTPENADLDVIPFDQHTIDVMSSLAGQAAVAVENNILYDSIEKLFEGFVTASVTAIEQRDPTTSGHSFRVADLTVELARAADHFDRGEFEGVRFSPQHLREIRYASLLHDFGKVGVRENVLVKEKKLYPLQLDLIRSRFDYLRKAAESASYQKRFEWLIRNGEAGFAEASRGLDEELKRELEQLERDFEIVAHSNEPTVLPEGEFAYLQELAQRTFEGARGEVRQLLEPEEANILSIRKGSLDARERSEIESHVTHTFQFLSKIPWTRDLSKVPDYAYAHHEKLNGRGYPRRLNAAEIPLQSRMMTVS